MTKPSALAQLYSAQIQAQLSLCSIEKTGLLIPEEIAELNSIIASLAMLGCDIERRTGSYRAWRDHYLPDVTKASEAAE